MKNKDEVKLPLVKIRRSGERIWVQITEQINSTHSKGVVDSKARFGGVRYGDEIILKHDEILDVWEG